MIFKKSIKYKGIKYIRVREDYRDATNIQSRCGLYKCKYKGKSKISKTCTDCQRVMHILGAERPMITFGYMPIK